MSPEDKEFNDFMNELHDMLLKAHDEIIDKIRERHRKGCDNPKKVRCEENYITLTLEALKVKQMVQESADRESLN